MTRPQPAHGYSFGDTDAAAERLALLDRVFDAPSGALLTEAAARGVGLAVDLGCGPGHSTRRLAELTQPVQ
ncbi:MAG TPA: hypothetical protein VE990_16850, partial [Acidimicrobiales bacterium]|nr:hypothetical protein [Acidimicrobiales bacterium]